MQHRTASALIVSLVAIAACQDIPTDAEGVSRSPDPLRGPVFSTSVASECGGQTDLLDSRAQLEWASRADLGATSGVTSDGDGAYIGGAQGVHAKLFYHDGGCARSGDVVFDPDKNSYRPARKLTFYFPANSIGLSTAGVKSGAYMTLSGLMQLGSDVTWDPAVPVGRDAKIDAKYPGIARSLEFPDASAVRPGYPTTNLATPKFRIQYTGIAACETLEYDTIRSTRTAGGSAFAQLTGQRSSYDSAPLGQWTATRDGVWTVESAGSGAEGEHWAQCYVTKKGNLVANGTKMKMPFRVVVTELQ